MKTIHLYLSLFHILLIATRIVVGADLAQSWIDSGTWRVYVGHSKKIRQDTSGNNFILQMIHSFFFLLLFERCTKSAENMSLDYRHPWSLDLSNFPPRKTEFSNIFFLGKSEVLAERWDDNFYQPLVSFHFNQPRRRWSRKKSKKVFHESSMVLTSAIGA